MSDAPLPWERQEGEGAQAFAKFVTYRNQPPSSRSARVAAALDSGREPARNAPGHYTLLSSQFDWVGRAAAWDDEQDRVAREAKLQEIREMNTRHTDLAKALGALAKDAIDQTSTEDVKPETLAGMVRAAIDYERLTRGVDTKADKDEREGKSNVRRLVLRVEEDSEDD